MTTVRANKPKTILVVEDNEDVRELVGAILRSAGYEVLEAENGLEALVQLETLTEPPCLLLLDLMMPVMSGPELLDALRARRQLASVPVIVFSAGGQPTQAPSAKRFIRKPADPKVLLHAVQEACGAP